MLLKKSVSYHAAKAMPAAYNINSGRKERGRLNGVWAVKQKIDTYSNFVGKVYTSAAGSNGSSVSKTNESLAN